MQGFKELLGSRNPTESYYQTVADPDLRDYLVRFEDAVIAKERKWPMRREHISHTGTSQQLELQKLVVALLERRVRHLGIIEPILTVDDNSSFHYRRRPKVICFDQDRLRAFAAICGKVKACIAEGRDVGGWENLVSETRAAIGRHSISNLINNPKNPTDLDDKELQDRILKLKREGVVSSHREAPRSFAGTVFNGGPLPLKKEIGDEWTGFRPHSPFNNPQLERAEEHIDRFRKAKETLLAAIETIVRSQLETFANWDRKKLSALYNRVPTNLDDFKQSLIEEKNPDRAKRVAQLIMFVGAAEALRKNLPEIYNAELEGLTCFVFRKGIQAVLNVMKERYPQSQDLGLVASVMAKWVNRVAVKEK